MPGQCKAKRRLTSDAEGVDTGQYKDLSNHEEGDTDVLSNRLAKGHGFWLLCKSLLEAVTNMRSTSEGESEMINRVVNTYIKSRMIPREKMMTART